MPAAITFGFLGKGALELMPTIGLDHIDMGAKDGGETISQKTVARFERLGGF